MVGTIGLIARDALSEHVVRINGSSQAGELLRPGNQNVVCAVFRDDSATERDGFLGLVPADMARVNPKSTFSELASFLPVEPLSAEAPLSQAKSLMAARKTDALPVFDEKGSFLGVVTAHSVMAALLARERDLSEKSRAYRKSVQEDKRKRGEWVRRLEQLNRAFRKLMGLLARPPAPEVFQRGVEALAVVLQAHYGAVSVLDPQGRFKESIFTGMTPGNPGDVPRFMEHRKALLDEIVRDDKTLLVHDVPQYLRKIGIPCRHPTLRSFVGVPISREGEVFGCVYFCDKESGDPFTEDDEVLTASFAQGLALVFSQVREREQRRRAERERDLLSRMALQLASADEPEKVGEIVARIADEFWEWDAFILAVRRGGHERFKAIVQIDKAAEPQYVGSGAEIISVMPKGASDEQREFDAKLLSGEAVLINRTDDKPTPALAPFGSDKLSASLLFAPVRAANDVVGIVSVQSYTPQRFSEQDRDLLLQLADSIGPALARCQAEKRTAAFASLGLRLSNAGSPLEAAEIIVDVADELLSWDACSIYFHNPETGRSNSILHMDLVNGKRIKVEPPDPYGRAGPLASRAIKDGPQLILREKAEFEPSDIEPFGDVERPSASLLFVPLRTSNRLSGILSIQSYTKNAYNEKDLQLLQALGDHCSGALERTRLEQVLRENANV